jgi:hypothetical protein
MRRQIFWGWLYLFLAAIPGGSVIAESALPSTASAKPENVPIDSLLFVIKSAGSKAVADCEQNQSNSDSIAIAYFDALACFGDALYDRCPCGRPLSAKGSSQMPPWSSDSVLAANGIVSIITDNQRIFKGDPAFVLKVFDKYLTAAGKAFFSTRAKDQLQSALCDDGLFLLPADTIAERLFLWDAFCSAYPNSYAGRRGEEFKRRYLGFYVPYRRSTRSPLAGKDVLIPSYRKYVLNHGSTKSGRLIADYLALITTQEQSITRIDSLAKAHDIPELFRDGITHEKGNDRPVIAKLFMQADSSQFGADFHGDEIKCYRGDEPWLALVRNGDVWSLLPAKPAFKRYFDALTDEDGQTSGVRITLAMRGVQFLCLLKGLKAGSVATVGFKGVVPPLPDAGTVTEFSFLDKRYTVISRFVFPQQALQERLFIGRNGNRKYFFPPCRDCEGSPALLWLGDLDRDGRLDAIYDDTDHTNVSYIRLLLSAQAQPGELMRYAAGIDRTGD